MRNIGRFSVLRLQIFGVLVLLCSCGTPANEELAQVNSPKNLSIVSTESGLVRIHFDAYNAEPLFKGYNVYMHSRSENELRVAHSRHVVENQINKEIEKQSIVANSVTAQYPTIQEIDTFSVSHARLRSTSITYTIRLAPNSQVIGATKWFLGVSAFASNNIESELSNVVQVS